MTDSVGGGGRPAASGAMSLVLRRERAGARGECPHVDALPAPRIVDLALDLHPELRRHPSRAGIPRVDDRDQPGQPEARESVPCGSLGGFGREAPPPRARREAPPELRSRGELGQERRVCDADEPDQLAAQVPFASLDGEATEPVLSPVIAGARSSESVGRTWSTLRSLFDLNVDHVRSRARLALRSGAPALVGTRARPVGAADPVAGEVLERQSLPTARHFFGAGRTEPRRREPRSQTDQSLETRVNPAGFCDSHLLTVGDHAPLAGRAGAAAGPGLTPARRPQRAEPARRPP
jgi:hypothetical protein